MCEVGERGKKMHASRSSMMTQSKALKLYACARRRRSTSSHFSLAKTEPTT
jgi:hypothetical protein